MSRSKAVQIFLFASALWWGSLSCGWTQTTNQNFINQMNNDYQAISSYVNGQFAKSMGFFSTLGWNTPPGVFDLLGAPKVEVGVGAGADVVNLTNINSLPLQALSVASNVSLPAVIPIPFPIGTARVGIFNGMDLGFRLAYLPLINIPDVGLSANYTGWGLDFRYKILDGIQWPTVTVGASWDTMNGSFSLSTNVNQSSTFVSSGTTYNDTLAGSTNFTQSWNVNSFGAKIMVGKDLGVIYPFAAIGFQRNSGSVSANITGTVTETVTDSGGVNQPGSPSTISVTSQSAGTPVIFEPKYVLGFDLGEGFHWAVVGESNGTDIAGSTSFRVQF
jgi:hypothetical protein